MFTARLTFTFAVLFTTLVLLFTTFVFLLATLLATFVLVPTTPVALPTLLCVPAMCARPPERAPPRLATSSTSGLSGWITAAVAASGIAAGDVAANGDRASPTSAIVVRCLAIARTPLLSSQVFLPLRSIVRRSRHRPAQ